MRELSLVCSSMGVLQLWVLKSFFHYCKFSFVSKIIFQSLFLEVSFTPNHVSYCFLFFYIYLSHLYFSGNISHHIISKCSTTQFRNTWMWSLSLTKNLSYLQMIGHSVLGFILWCRAQTVDLSNTKSTYSFFIFIFQASTFIWCGDVKSIQTSSIMYFLITDLFYILTYFCSCIMPNSSLCTLFAEKERKNSCFFCQINIFLLTSCYWMRRICLLNKFNPFLYLFFFGVRGD